MARALNQHLSGPRQFIDLNRDIGGFDRDMNHIAARHKSDAQAAKRAIESGRILSGGGGGLASTKTTGIIWIMIRKEIFICSFTNSQPGNG